MNYRKIHREKIKAAGRKQRRLAIRWRGKRVKHPKR